MGMCLCSGARTISRMAAISAAVSWPGRSRGQAERSSRGAAVGGAAPGVVARRGEPDDVQGQGEGQGRLGALDGAQELRLRGSLGEAMAHEAKAGGPQEGEEEADDGGEDPRTAFEVLGPGHQVGVVLVEGREGDDRAQAAAFPARDRRAWDGKAKVEGAGIGAADVLAETMVVGVAVQGKGSERRRHRRGLQGRVCGRRRRGVTTGRRSAACCVSIR